MTKIDAAYELFRTGNLSLKEITVGVRICEDLDCDDCPFTYKVCSGIFNQALPRLTHAEFYVFLEKYPEAKVVL